MREVRGALAARSFCLGFPGLAFGKLPAPWSRHDLRVQRAPGCGGGRVLHHHLELIGVFLKPEAAAGFPPSFCRPWNGSTCTQGQGHLIPGMMSVPDPGAPAPCQHQPRFWSASFHSFHPASVTALQSPPEFQGSLSPALWPPLVSASRTEMLSPRLHEELARTEKRQEINVPASRLHRH